MEKDIRDIYPYERYLGAFEHMKRTGRANAKALLGFLAGYLVSTHESIVTGLHMIGRYAPEFATYWVAAKAEPVPPGFFAHAYPGDNTKVFVTLYPPWVTDCYPWSAFRTVLEESSAANPCWQCGKLCFLDEVPETWPRYEDADTVVVTHMFKCKTCVETHGLEIPHVNEFGRRVRVDAQRSVDDEEKHRVAVQAKKERKDAKRTRREGRKVDT